MWLSHPVWNLIPSLVSIYQNCTPTLFWKDSFSCRADVVNVITVHWPFLGRVMWSQTCEAWIERRNVDPSFTLLFSSRLSDSAAIRVSVWQWRGLLMFKTAECFRPEQWVSAVEDTTSTRPCFSTSADNVTNRKSRFEWYVCSLVWLFFRHARLG